MYAQRSLHPLTLYYAWPLIQIIYNLVGRFRKLFTQIYCLQNESENNNRSIDTVVLKRRVSVWYSQHPPGFHTSTQLELDDTGSLHLRALVPIATAREAAYYCCSASTQVWTCGAVCHLMFTDLILGHSTNYIIEYYYFVLLVKKRFPLITFASVWSVCLV